MFNSMKIYSVHIKPGMMAAQQRPVFVKEGFNFWAFVLGFFWMLYQRLWLPALVLFAFNVALVFMLKGHILSAPSIGAVNTGFNVIVGFSANDWLRAKLSRRGYILADVSAADTLPRAEQRYFERILGVAA
jgi:hypothetical protein